MSTHILGYLLTYNEADIIADTLAWYDRAGVPLILLDNGSTDGTLEVARAGHWACIVEYASLPTPTCCWEALLREAMARTLAHRPDWVLHIDADQLYEPGAPYASLHAMAEAAVARGDNCICFAEYRFWPTPADPPDGPLACRLRYYRATGITPRRQPRLFRAAPGVDVAWAAGHDLRYASAPVRYFPTLGVLRHYPFRSRAHAQRKLADRRRRRDPAEYARGWNTHYDQFTRERDYVGEVAHLHLRVEGEPWHDEDPGSRAWR
jgi:hypothetical protein